MNPIVRAFALILALTSLGPAAASAAPPAPTPAAPSKPEAKTRVEVLVAEVSTTGTSVDPRLAGVARDFKRNGLAFTNYALIQTATLNLAEGAPGSFIVRSLQNGKDGKVELTLLARDPSGKLKLRVSTPGSASELSMPPHGEAFIEAGSRGANKLFLVLRR